jgi:hypothetical protein
MGEEVVVVRSGSAEQALLAGAGDRDGGARGAAQ